MIFLRYENVREYIRQYPVTAFLLGLQIVMFLVETALGGSTNTGTLLRLGAVYGSRGAEPNVDFPWNGPPGAWRYAAAIFLHNGFQHLLFNSFSLYVFAPPLERLLGHLKYAFLYLLSGIAGNAASELLYRQPFVSVGASGAIFGVFAALLFLGLFRRDILEQRSGQTIMIVAGISFAYSFIVPHINIYAHAGGFLCGFLLLALLSPAISKKPG